jgi:predicted NBD/HSP70 family sugar kinase
MSPRDGSSALDDNRRLRVPGAAGRGDAGPGALLALILEGGDWTRARLVAESGLARSTVADRLATLLDAGLVTAAPGASTGGRPAELFRFHEQGGHFLVADIGSTHTRVGLTDLGGTLCAVHDADLDVAAGPAEVLGYVRTAFAGLLAEAGVAAASVRGVGLGVPSPVELDGRLLRPPGAATPGGRDAWDQTVVAEATATGLDDMGLSRVPVAVDKDANILTLGEHRTTWSQYDDVIVLKVGMSIGCGLVVGGRIARGARGVAGAIGHIPDGVGPLCRCGQRGCAEATASGAAIAAALAADGVSLRTSRDVVELARTGHRRTLELLDRAGQRLGALVADAVSTLNPSLVVVGGNLAEDNEPLLTAIREVVLARAHPYVTRHLQIVRSRIAADAGLIGAAHLVRDRVLAAEAVDAALVPQGAAARRGTPRAAHPRWGRLLSVGTQKA